MSGIDIHVRVESLSYGLSQDAPDGGLQGTGLVNVSRDGAEAIGGLNELTFILSPDKTEDGSLGQLSVMEEPATMTLSMADADVAQLMALVTMTTGYLGISATLEEDRMGTWKVTAYRLRRRFG